MCTITDACILTEDPHTLSFPLLGLGVSQLIWQIGSMVMTFFVYWDNITVSDLRVVGTISFKVSLIP